MSTRQNRNSAIAHELMGKHFLLATSYVTAGRLVLPHLYLEAVTCHTTQLHL